MFPGFICSVSVHAKTPTVALLCKQEVAVFYVLGAVRSKADQRGMHAFHGCKELVNVCACEYLCVRLLDTDRSLC